VNLRSIARKIYMFSLKDLQQLWNFKLFKALHLIYFVFVNSFWRCM